MYMYMYLYRCTEMDTGKEEENPSKLNNTKPSENQDKQQRPHIPDKSNTPQPSQRKMAKHEGRHCWYVSDDEQ